MQSFANRCLGACKLKRSFDLFLQDIIDAIEKIGDYVSDMDAGDFEESSITIDAVVRNIEIIGEAISNLPVALREKYANIPWQEIKDFRNVVIHKYHSVDVEILWDIIQHKLEPLSEQIATILQKETK